MRYLALTTILIVTTGVAMSQQRPKYETLPDHTVLLTMASQANCSVRIESATFQESRSTWRTDKVSPTKRLKQANQFYKRDDPEFIEQ